MAVSQTLTLTQISQDCEQNTSRVRILWQSTQTGESYNLNRRQATYTVTVGQEHYTCTVEYALHLRTTDTIVDTEITVPHDSAGAATVTVDTWMDTRISAGVVRLTSTKVLTDIPRECTVSVSAGELGEGIFVAVDRKNSAYQYSLFFDIGGRYRFYLGTQWDRVAQETLLTEEQVFCPGSDDDYGALAPDEDRVSCFVRCTTYCDGVQIGKPQTEHFTLQAEYGRCCPVLTCRAEDINPVTLALTGDPLQLIRYYSTVECTMVAEPRQGASIQSRVICGIPLNAGENSKTVAGALAEDYTFSATDSRGFTQDETLTLGLTPYLPVTCEAVTRRPMPTGDTVQITVTGEWFHGSFGAVDNSITVTLCPSGGAPVTLTPEVDGNTFRLETDMQFDYEQSCPLEITVADALSAVTKTLTVMQGIPVFDWGRQDVRFHVPIAAPNCLTWKKDHVGNKDGLTEPGAYSTEEGILAVLGDGEDTAVQILFDRQGNMLHRMMVQGIWQSWTA